MKSTLQGVAAAPSPSPPTEDHSHMAEARYRALPLQLSNLPAELREGSLFCSWIFTPDEKNPRKLKKKPMCPRTGRSADTSRHWDFTTLDEAVQAFEKHRHDGVGRLIQQDTDMIYAIDVDNCVTDGVLNEYALDLVKRAGTYAEITVSGRGIRIICKGPIPAALLNRCSVKPWDKGKHPEYPATAENPGLEVQLFMRGQYVTLSGNQIEGTPSEVVSNPEFLDYLLRQNPAKLQEYFPDEAGAPRSETSGRLSDHESLERPTTGTPNAGRTRARIARLCKTNQIFNRNYQRQIDPTKPKSRKSDSEFQKDLVVCLYVTYQAPREDLEYMCQLWCKRHNVKYKAHRMNSWLRDAQKALEKALANGRKTYRQYETERKREYRARIRAQQPPTPTTPVGMRDTVAHSRRAQGELSKQVADLRKAGKSQREIAAELGVKRRTVRTTIEREASREELLKPNTKPPASSEAPLWTGKFLRALYEQHLKYGEGYRYWTAEDEAYVDPSFECWREWFESIEYDEADHYIEELETREIAARQEAYWESRRTREFRQFLAVVDSVLLYGSPLAALVHDQELRSIPKDILEKGLDIMLSVLASEGNGRQEVRPSPVYAATAA